ncbi:MAG TPA: transcriptional regulator [Gaiellaceae bacterium]
MNSPTGFDPVIHAPNRLQICALLSAVDSAEFATVRDAVGVSDSVLSKQVRTLQEAGYISVRKAPLGSRTHTWLALTKSGRSAFDAHVAALQQILATKTPESTPA